MRKHLRCLRFLKYLSFRRVIFFLLILPIMAIPVALMLQPIPAIGTISVLVIFGVVAVIAKIPFLNEEEVRFLNHYNSIIKMITRTMMTKQFWLKDFPWLVSTAFVFLASGIVIIFAWIFISPKNKKDK